MRQFFDLFILMGITITAYPAVILLYSSHKRKQSWEYRHKKISYFLSIILLLGTTILIYGSFIEPKILITTYQEIKINKFNNPLKIALVTDIQAGNFISANDVEKIVERIIKLKPDLVLLGGDQVDNEVTIEDETIYLEPLKKLTPLFPVYAINGNHEYGIGGGLSISDPAKRTGDVSESTKKALEKMGIKFLKNDIEKISINGNNFYLFGGDEFWSGKLETESLKKINEPLPIIALIHNPTAIFSIKEKIDIIISGHTHGGQIRFPFIGPIGRVDNILPSNWYRGLQEYNNIKLFVSSGTGESGARARLFDPPEVVLLTIK